MFGRSARWSQPGSQRSSQCSSRYTSQGPSLCASDAVSSLASPRGSRTSSGFDAAPTTRSGPVPTIWSGPVAPGSPLGFHVNKPTAKSSERVWSPRPSPRLPRTAISAWSASSRASAAASKRPSQPASGTQSLRPSKPPMRSKGSTGPVGSRPASSPARTRVYPDAATRGCGAQPPFSPSKTTHPPSPARRPASSPRRSAPAACSAPAAAPSASAHLDLAASATLPHAARATRRKPARARPVDAPPELLDLTGGLLQELLATAVLGSAAPGAGYYGHRGGAHQSRSSMEAEATARDRPRGTEYAMDLDGGGAGGRPLAALVPPARGSAPPPVVSVCEGPHRGPSPAASRPVHLDAPRGLGADQRATFAHGTSLESGLQPSSARPSDTIPSEERYRAEGACLVRTRSASSQGADAWAAQRQGGERREHVNVHTGGSGVEGRVHTGGSVDRGCVHTASSVHSCVYDGGC